MGKSKVWRGLTLPPCNPWRRSEGAGRVQAQRHRREIPGKKREETKRKKKNMKKPHVLYSKTGFQKKGEQSSFEPQIILHHGQRGVVKSVAKTCLDSLFPQNSILPSALKIIINQGYLLSNCFTGMKMNRMKK